MRVSMLLAGLVVAIGVFSNLGGAEPAPERPRRIVPLVAIKPGETKELLLCTPLPVLTRGGGLTLEAMGQPRQRSRTAWSKDGLTIKVPDMGAAFTAARAPAYKPLQDKGLNAFVVTVTAKADARPGLLPMHLADETCSGTCEADFEVLVVAP